MIRRSRFEKKMSMLEILSTGPQIESALMRRANLPWGDFRLLMHQLERTGSILHLPGKKWSRSEWTLSEKGRQVLELWLKVSALLGEEPLLKPVLMAW